MLDGELGAGFSGRAFVEYAPYIHEIGLKLSGGYLWFEDTETVGIEPLADVELRVHVNADGVRDGVGPQSHGAAVHTEVMKTLALKQALDRIGLVQPAEEAPQPAAAPHNLPGH